MTSGDNGTNPNNKSDWKPPKAIISWEIDDTKRYQGETRYKYYRRRLLHKYHHFHAERHIAISTWVLALATWGLAVLTYCTLQDNRQVAKTQSRLTRESNQINREAFTNVQRAFVIVTADEPVAVENGNWRFTPIVKNSGNTPTKDLEIVFLNPSANTFTLMDEARGDPNYSDRLSFLLKQSRRIGPSDPRNLFNYPSANPLSIGRIKMIIGPKDSTTLDPYFVISLHIPAMNLGTLSPYYYGAARYHDQFSEEWHITKFCWNLVSKMELGVGKVSPEGDVPRRQMSNMRPVLGLCGHWNCADKECDRDRDEYEKDLAAYKPDQSRALPTLPPP